MKLIHSCISVLPLLCITALSTAQSEPFTSVQLVPSLTFSNPYEITYGPNDSLWLTERVGKKVILVSPVNGGRRTILDLAGIVYQAAGQDGLMGLAIHPAFGTGTGQDYVFLSYTYDNDPGAGVQRRTKIVRYTYTTGTTYILDPSTATEVIAGLQASADHNSGRIDIGPDLKLYYTIGDMGNNQFGNKCNLVRALELPTAAELASSDYTKYQGKILRMNLDGSIPGDNPAIDPDGAGPESSVVSHIFSYGHRNPQGVIIAPDGKVYSDEHGPKSDDEINYIIGGKNYGWPRVAGYQDNQAYVYGEWGSSSPTSCASLTFSDYTIPPSVPQYTEGSYSHPDLTDPIQTLYTVADGYNFQDPACSGMYYICWPTVAPSSLDIYTKTTGGIPAWANSLLVTSLKNGSVLRYKLSADGTSISGSEIEYFNTTNRYRDIAINPAGTEFYIITDNSGNTKGPISGYTSTLDNPGTILKYTYTGILLPLQNQQGNGPVRVSDLADIFPNPANELVTIKGKRESRKPLQVQICSIDGKLMKEQQSFRNEFQISVAALPPGIYVIKLLNGNGMEVQLQKLVVQ